MSALFEKSLSDVIIHQQLALRHTILFSLISQLKSKIVQNSVNTSQFPLFLRAIWTQVTTANSKIQILKIFPMSPCGNRAPTCQYFILLPLKKFGHLKCFYLKYPSSVSSAYVFSKRQVGRYVVQYLVLFQVIFLNLKRTNLFFSQHLVNNTKDVSCYQNTRRHVLFVTTHFTHFESKISFSKLFGWYLQIREL